MIKILHIVGNKIEPSNGIGRLLPEMIEMQNKFSTNIHCTLCCINDVYITSSFKVINKNEVKHINIDDYDLFIFHGLYFWSYISFAKKILSKKKSYLIKPHSSLIINAQKKSFIKKRIANLLYFKTFVKNAKAIIFTNEDEEKNSVRWNPNVLFEGNGLTSIQSSDIDIKQKQKQKPYKFVYLSRIDFTHKGTDILLDALDLLKEIYNIKDLHLSIYGKGSKEEENELIRRIKKLNFTNVAFYGAIYGNHKYDMFNKKDIFILTSRYEGFPMAILEALDAGLPCLVTRGVNMTSIIEKYHVGWECQTTPQSVANMILSALGVEQDVLNEMSRQARKYIIEEHNWPALAKYSESLYKQVCERKQ
ncbi:glycosyltransferase [Escherichia coli]|uniref:Putative glycosyltransferase n=1 Tax=Escherichia coli TaxID=562 RepID=A0A6S6KK95_ECOLX|nr:glycosyltransferase [Escherichia coli]AUK11072.1 hypothetical protein CR536_10010 [Escherichia coli]EGE2274202.1 hypothetical protein [Escherichia coli]EHB0097926.1 glycosyltransferase [Escherichia coli]EIC3811708.1 glycosyltransferase [Escherichia coli]MCI5307522.1 glycosyltransferase [Escherichia coli]